MLVDRHLKRERIAVVFQITGYVKYQYMWVYNLVTNSKHTNSLCILEDSADSKYYYVDNLYITFSDRQLSMPLNMHVALVELKWK